MILSHTHNFAILVPWKTASSTLHARFEALNESPYSRFYYFSPYLNRVVHQHITCAEFSAFPESRLGYATAAFVRNPYDRVFSGFIQMQRDLRDQGQAAFPSPWIREIVLRQLDENRAALARADCDFDRWVAGLSEADVYVVGRNTSLPLHPVHYWTHMAGEKCVSFIGRVETFEADLAAFCTRAGIADPERLNRNVSDGGDGDGEYRYAAAMRPATRDKIERLFVEDFALFRYRTF